jgi:hypothetical protein
MGLPPSHAANSHLGRGVVWKTDESLGGWSSQGYRFNTNQPLSLAGNFFI